MAKQRRTAGGQWARMAALVVLAGFAAATAGGCRVATLGLGENQVASGDGLGLKFDLAGKVVAVTLENKELPAQLSRMLLPGGFFVRESLAGIALDQELLGDVKRSKDGLVITGSPAGLKLVAHVQSKPDRIEVSGQLTGAGPVAASRDRAVTVGLNLPVNAAGWLIGHSLLERETISWLGLTTYAEWTPVSGGREGQQINRGLFTPIYNEAVGLALGAATDQAEVFRVCYRQGQGFSIEADLVLSPAATTQPEGNGSFKFVFFRFEPAKGYRSALAKYYRMFPQDYRARAAKFGMFDPTAISSYDASKHPEQDLDRLAFLRTMVGGERVGGLPAYQGGTAPADPSGSAQLERALNILLPYGLFCGGPWTDELRRKYFPPIQDMAAAGWEPLSGAVLVHPDLLVERYGGPKSEKVFYVVHNRGEKTLNYEMAIDLAPVNIDPATVAVVDRLAGGKAPEATTVEHSLVLRSTVGPQGSNLFQLSRTGGNIKPNAQLTLPESPRQSSIKPAARPGLGDKPR